MAEEKKSRLMYVLNQFKPVRCRIHWKYLEENVDLDGPVYMDMNAQMMDDSAILLDEVAGLDENMIIL